MGYASSSVEDLQIDLVLVVVLFIYAGKFSQVYNNEIINHKLAITHLFVNPRAYKIDAAKLAAVNFDDLMFSRTLVKRFSF